MFRNCDEGCKAADAYIAAQRDRFPYIMAMPECERDVVAPVCPQICSRFYYIDEKAIEQSEVQSLKANLSMEGDLAKAPQGALTDIHRGMRCVGGLDGTCQDATPTVVDLLPQGFGELEDAVAEAQSSLTWSFQIESPSFQLEGLSWGLKLEV